MPHSKDKEDEMLKHVESALASYLEMKKEIEELKKESEVLQAKIKKRDEMIKRFILYSCFLVKIY